MAESFIKGIIKCLSENNSYLTQGTVELYVSVFSSFRSYTKNWPMSLGFVFTH